MNVKLSYINDLSGFPTYRPSEIKGNESIHRIYDAIDWLNEYNISYTRSWKTNVVIFSFKNKEDVMAFKLRWL